MSVPFKYKQLYRDLYDYLSNSKPSLSTADFDLFVRKLDPPFPTTLVANYAEKAPMAQDTFLAFVAEGQKATGENYETMLWKHVAMAVKYNLFSGADSMGLKDFRTMIDPSLKMHKKEAELTALYHKACPAAAEGAGVAPEAVMITAAEASSFLQALSKSVALFDVLKVLLPKKRGGKTTNVEPPALGEVPSASPSVPAPSPVSPTSPYTNAVSASPPPPPVDDPPPLAATTSAVEAPPQNKASSSPTPTPKEIDQPPVNENRPPTPPPPVAHANPGLEIPADAAASPSSAPHVEPNPLSKSRNDEMDPAGALSPSPSAVTRRPSLVSLPIQKVGGGDLRNHSHINTAAVGNEGPSASSSSFNNDQRKETNDQNRANSAHFHSTPSASVHHSKLKGIEHEDGYDSLENSHRHGGRVSDRESASTPNAPQSSAGSRRRQQHQGTSAASEPIMISDDLQRLAHEQQAALSLFPHHDSSAAGGGILPLPRLPSEVLNYVTELDRQRQLLQERLEEETAQLRNANTAVAVLKDRIKHLSASNAAYFSAAGIGLESDENGVESSRAIQQLVASTGVGRDFEEDQIRQSIGEASQMDPHEAASLSPFFQLRINRERLQRRMEEWLAHAKEHNIFLRQEVQLAKEAWRYDKTSAALAAQREIDQQRYAAHHGADKPLLSTAATVTPLVGRAVGTGGFSVLVPHEAEAAREIAMHRGVPSESVEGSSSSPGGHVDVMAPYRVARFCSEMAKKDKELEEKERLLRAVSALEAREQQLADEIAAMEEEKARSAVGGDTSRHPPLRSGSAGASGRLGHEQLREERDYKMYTSYNEYPPHQHQHAPSISHEHSARPSSDGLGRYNGAMAVIEGNTVTNVAREGSRAAGRSMREVSLPSSDHLQAQPLGAMDNSASPPPRREVSAADRYRNSGGIAADRNASAASAFDQTLRGASNINPLRSPSHPNTHNGYGYGYSSSSMRPTTYSTSMAAQLTHQSPSLRGATFQRRDPIIAEREAHRRLAVEELARQHQQLQHAALAGRGGRL